MSAFDRIHSGIPTMDQALDNIRLGDNVVWQVSSLDDFRAFMEPFVRQAIADGRNLIYVRFASHPPLVAGQEGVKIVPIELSHRFETFTVEIHNLIEAEGYDAFYVFDCLSELQTAWSTDLMMGNFFHLTCPFLFSLDTVAYFPVLRGLHSFEAIAKIRDTTQLFFDVYPDADGYFVRPMKVWNRYSRTMFLPHFYSSEMGTFREASDGLLVSRFYQLMNQEQAADDERNIDSWERFFRTTQEKYRRGEDVADDCGRLCNIMLTRDEHLRLLIKEHFRPEDYFEIHRRMIGTGMIGGKACGMLLARKLIENLRPDIMRRIEPHDSFYIGSDVFYAFIVDNGFWDLRLRQRTEAEYFSLAETFAEHIQSGQFSASLKERFIRLLDYYGQDPVIVRSSSILEDGFGNAFAGKYDSVFCSNSGSMEDRLLEFENAIRTVYASTMSLSALDYRKRRGLDRRDEQMAILVQRVSGMRYDRFFMPCAAGVGYSSSPYRTGSIDAGMLRLVMGLGTAAVDRSGGSYPRIVDLAQPCGRQAISDSGRHTYSQRVIDTVNTENGNIDGWDINKITRFLPYYLKKCLLTHDYEAERAFRDRGERREICFVSCDGLVKNEGLMGDMRDILALLAAAYEYPVDTEFTINLSESGEYVIDILQCRPLQTAGEGEEVSVPIGIPEEDIALESVHSGMGLSRHFRLDYAVVIDPVGYYQLEYREKYRVRNALSAVNWHFRGKGKRLLLLAPGRICTSSPELGVPSAFADISEFDVIGEVSDSRAGYRPELSYGSHIFQDLVEAEILYTAVFENEKTKVYRPEMFAAGVNRLAEIYPEGADLDGIVHVYDLADAPFELCYDMREEQLAVWRG